MISDTLFSYAVVYFIFFGTFALIGGLLTKSSLGAWTGFVGGPLGMYMILHAMLVKELVKGKEQKTKPKPYEHI